MKIKALLFPEDLQWLMLTLPSAKGQAGNSVNISLPLKTCRKIYSLSSSRVVAGIIGVKQIYIWSFFFIIKQCCHIVLANHPE